MSDDTARWNPAAGRTDVTTEAGFGPPVAWSKFEVYRRQLPVFIRKNRGLAADPAFWRLLPRLVAQRRRMSAAPSDGRRLFGSCREGGGNSKAA